METLLHLGKEIETIMQLSIKYPKPLITFISYIDCNIHEHEMHASNIIKIRSKRGKLGIVYLSFMGLL